MKSTLMTYYDYRSEPVPESLTYWRVSDEEIQERLMAIARANAQEVSVALVETGDAVSCVCIGDSSIPGREHVLLYPGLDIPGAGIAERAVIGKRVGEAFDTVVGVNPLVLQVEEIRRRYPAQINDDLVQGEYIDGVKTVADFACWYREQNEPERKRIAQMNIASFWMQEVEKKSQLLIDPEERLTWAMRHAKQRFDSLVAAGIDPCIPEEGFDFLTEEQALQQIADGLLLNFNLVVAVRGIADRKGIVLDEEWLEKRYQQIAASEAKSVEQVRAENDAESILERDYMNRVQEMLMAEAERFLEV